MSLHDARYVRTNRQLREIAMTHDIKAVFKNARETILRDALGLAALIVILFGGLALPGLA